MSKTPFTAIIEEDGVMIELQLDTNFLNFYKKETGHKHVTKRGVAKFLQHLIKYYQGRFKECCS